MTPERRAKIDRVLSHRQPNLTVVLENVHDPHNISAVMRTCDAVGVQEIFILNNSIELHDKYGRKSSASAADWLTMHQYEDTAACMNAISQKGYRIFGTHLGKQASSLYQLDLTQPTALVFGNEHAGITEACQAHCDGNFIIPQMGMIQSLNISVACAISLYEAYRQREHAGLYDGTCRLPGEQQQTLQRLWKMYD